MKVTFIYPRFEKFLSGLPELDAGLVDYFLGNFTTPPSLGIPILAALTPSDIEVAFVDDNGGMPLDFDAPTDLVAINCFTPQATRAFEIADGFRARGRQVIMGGFFPSFMAEECLKHADSVNIGEGEPTWLQILEDARRGTLKPKYHGGHGFDLARMPIPRREIFYGVETYDWDEDLVQVTRGCSYGCHMCAIPAHMGNRIRFRPIEKVVEEVRGLKHENVYLADDSLFFPQRRTREYAEALFKALEPLGKKYFVSSTMALNVDPAFLDLAVKAGMRNFYCTMNVDPVSIKALQGEERERRLLIDLVKGIEDRGARFFASCAIGRDWDGPDIGTRVLDIFDAAGIRTSEFFLFTPYPGTPLWDRLERQGRIIDRTWSHYNGAHVVTRPLNMTPEQLREEFLLVWREFFKRQKERHATHLEPSTWKEGRQVVGKPLRQMGVENQAVITGIGLLSPIGNDPETVTESLRTGRHGIVPITRFDAGFFRSNLVGEVPLDPKLGLDDPELAQFDDPYLRFAVVAARQALRDAGVQTDPLAPRSDIALVLGTCNGGLRSGEAEYSWKHGKSEAAFDERMNLQAQFYGFGKAMANALGISGEAWVVTTACSSTTAALGLAQLLINRGHFTTVLVGGADVLCVANMAGFDALKATAPGRMAPFSQPCGINIGEAACFWVVESMEQALLRKARLLGRLAGHATTADAYHPTSPDPRGGGVYRTLRDALADSGLPIEQIGCINAHGSGTDANDRAESKGIQKFIGEHRIPVVSTKSFFGHCMGATGILETTCQLLAMNAGFIPPTLNFSEARPGCTLDYVPNEARTADYPAFVSANYAFGGNNAAVVVTRWDHPTPPRPRRTGRVVITGLGTVTAAGLGTTRLLEALRAGRTGVAPVTRFPLPERVRSRLAGMVEPFRESAVDRRLDFTSLNDISRYAVSAASLALADARLRVGQANADRIGVTMGVCNGTAETAHMDSVFGSDTFAGQVGSFSNIVPNSTAGWVSASLQLRGVNCTLAAGPHAGLQSLAYAYEALVEERALAVVAAASDEIYPQTYYNYDTMGLLCQGAEEEEEFRIRPEDAKRKVLGEGAAALVLETAPAALERGATILAEVLGQGMTMDSGGFQEPNLDPEGLCRAIRLALQRAEASADEVELLVWAPQGNRQDLKVLEACGTVFGEQFANLPLAGSSFTTGFIESASILVSLAATLQSLKEGNSLWPAKTGLADVDARELKAAPRLIMAVASSDVGYNFAVLLRKGWVD